MMKLMLMKILMLIRQVHQKSLLFVAIGIFWKKGLNFNLISVMGCVMMYNDVYEPALAILLFQALMVLIIIVLLTELAKVKP